MKDKSSSSLQSAEGFRGSPSPLFRKVGTDFLEKLVGVRQGVMVLNKKRFGLDNKEHFFCNDGGEILDQVAQRCGGCPMLGNVQDQAVWCAEQPGLVADIPSHSREVEHAFRNPFQPKLLCEKVR